MMRLMIGDERLTEGSIYDIKFAYNSKLVGYATLMPHMKNKTPSGKFRAI